MLVMVLFRGSPTRSVVQIQFLPTTISKDSIFAFDSAKIHSSKSFRISYWRIYIHIKFDGFVNFTLRHSGADGELFASFDSQFGNF